MSSKRKRMTMKVLLPVDESRCSADAVQAVTERPWPAVYNSTSIVCGRECRASCNGPIDV